MNKIILLSCFFMCLNLFSCNKATEGGIIKSETKVETSKTESIAKTIEYDEFLKLYNQENVVIIDVRTSGEYNQGHIDKAVHIDVSSSSFKTKINELDKSKTYILYCRTQNRSSAALNYMKENGFKTIYNLKNAIATLTENNFQLVK